MPAPITNDAIILGILICVLTAIFWTSDQPRFRTFYRYCPALLLCYFVPALLRTTGVVNPTESNLYFVASRYLLPASLVLLTLGLDLKAIASLGPKIIIVFLAGTIGVVIGAPLSLLIVSAINPDLLGGQGPDAVWRGMTTLAGSWIGGGANQTAMKEVFAVGDDIFSQFVAVDVLVANLWLPFLLYGAGISKTIDKKIGADTTAIEELKSKIESYRKQHKRIASQTDVFLILAVGFGATAIGHFGADVLSPWIESNYPSLAKFSLTSKFFWIIVLATTIGVSLSMTSASKLEGAGASTIGSVFLYILVATIGMKMNLLAITESPELFLVGLIWIAIHAAMVVGVGVLIKAPFFFIAVGSQANIGGAASAPVVASAFHPSLAPVGVMMAVLGYALGTYAAWFCGIVLQMI